MAIQDKSLRGAEHDWFATQSGLPSNAPLSEHKAKYFRDQGYGESNPNATLNELELEWLKDIANSSSLNRGDLWRELVAAVGLTPSVKMSENQFIYYTQTI